MTVPATRSGSAGFAGRAPARVGRDTSFGLGNGRAAWFRCLRRRGLAPGRFPSPGLERAGVACSLICRTGPCRRRDVSCPLGTARSVRGNRSPDAGESRSSETSSSGRVDNVQLARCVAAAWRLAVGRRIRPISGRTVGTRHRRHAPRRLLASPLPVNTKRIPGDC